MIETGITITVYADLDYHYEIVDEELLEVRYVERGREASSAVGFGSVDEMEAVAKAMLKVVQIKRENG